ncbi:MAG: carbohydrate kinase [Gemmatimonadaceae bacterium]|nr:carbohydrate kinase [Gemmatimonadaceae bacterium]
MKQEPGFIVCGEALFDVFTTGSSPSGMSLDARVGGSPFNVAVGLARLAQSVAFFGALSRDAFGDFLAGVLAREGIDTSTVVRTGAPTTLSMVSLDEHGVPSYAFDGEGRADRQLSIGALECVPEGARAIHLGSYATVVEPIAGTLRALVDRERSKALIAYDPNVRLNVVSDPATWRRAVEWMLPRTDLLKVSEDDLRVLAPDASPEAFAAHALSAGVALVVLTRGPEGATGWTRDTEATVPAAPVQVIDTVGAGDTFQAALLTSLAERGALDRETLASLKGAEVREVLGFAARAAAITCSRRGADMPRRADLAASPPGAVH